MKALKVRKNLLLEQETVDKVSQILSSKHKNFTDAITLYFQALIKEPSLIDKVEDIASKRTGSFIGILDGKIGNEQSKDMKAKHHENLS